MKLLKVYSDDCVICQMLGESPGIVALRSGFDYEMIEVGELAASSSPLRDYVVKMYVEPNDGKIDLPVFLLITAQGEIQGSGICQDLEQVENLINAWKSWESSKNAESAV
jgi:hypothetical protein